MMGGRTEGKKLLPVIKAKTAGLILLLILAFTLSFSEGASPAPSGGHVSVTGGFRVPDGEYASVGAMVLGDPRPLPDEYDFASDLAFAFCSSTLIAPNVVLTAAHCLRAGKLYRYPTVVFGKNGKKGLLDSGPGIRRRVKSIAVNPHYSKSRTYGDVGLAFLSRPVTTIEPMRIGQPGVDPEPSFKDVVASAGWGISSFKGIIAAFGFMGPNLKIAWGHAAGPSACQKKSRFIGEHQLCMTGAKRFGSICDGDSGGPLALLDDRGGDATYASRKLEPLRLVGVNSDVIYPRKGEGCTHKAIDLFQSMAPSSPLNSWVRRTLAGRGIGI